MWDAGPAKVVADAGAKVIAKRRWSVATARGRSNGQALPLDLALAYLARIVTRATRPVTIELETGYGDVLHLRERIDNLNAPTIDWQPWRRPNIPIRFHLSPC